MSYLRGPGTERAAHFAAAEYADLHECVSKSSLSSLFSKKRASGHDRSSSKKGQ
jgi:hypothetical protein